MATLEQQIKIKLVRIEKRNLVEDTHGLKELNDQLVQELGCESGYEQRIETALRKLNGCVGAFNYLVK